MLTRKQRYRIGGAEYRALDLLARLVPLFYVVHVVAFAFGFRIYVAVSRYAQQVLEDGQVSPWYWSFYVSLASFNNLGLVPLDASMIPFINAPAPLLMSAALIILGNTGYAIALRFLLRLIYVLTPSSNVMDRDTLRLLLDHPRRCYSMLFTSTQTYWLIAILIVINLVEVTVFLATNFWLPVLQGIPWGSRVLDAFYQGVTIRNAGFTTISIMDLNPGTQIIYIVCMYISVYPVGISIRNSNIYQVSHLTASILCLCLRTYVCVLYVFVFNEYYALQPRTVLRNVSWAFIIVITTSRKRNSKSLRTTTPQAPVEHVSNGFLHSAVR
ncbi:cation transport protein-domain-containing protein [Syncephalastrum racemosum]|uniref:Cation transport protein-domain-containing protein n=1 Tax=Syncephalastrum racemosum TaxID=13706 RepID=A0A1X2HR02_SYNRA|nr:cation transport protein-domain-containing protein [Syncephalastrum racemosum]